MKLQTLIFGVDLEIVKIDRAGFKFWLHKDQHHTAGNGARRGWHVTLGLVPLTINSGLLFCVDGTNFSPFQNPTIFSQTFHSQDTKIFGAPNRCVLWRSTKHGSVKDGSCLNVEAPLQTGAAVALIQWANRTKSATRSADPFPSDGLIERGPAFDPTIGAFEVATTPQAILGRRRDGDRQVACVGGVPQVQSDGPGCGRGGGRHAFLPLVFPDHIGLVVQPAQGGLLNPLTIEKHLFAGTNES